MHNKHNEHGSVSDLRLILMFVVCLLSCLHPLPMVIFLTFEWHCYRCWKHEKELSAARNGQNNTSCLLLMFKRLFLSAHFFIISSIFASQNTALFSVFLLHFVSCLCFNDHNSYYYDRKTAS